MAMQKDLTPEEMTLYALKGVLSEMPAASQALVDKCMTDIRKAMAEAGETEGLMALGIVGAEMAVLQAKGAGNGN